MSEFNLTDTLEKGVSGEQLQAALGEFLSQGEAVKQSVLEIATAPQVDAVCSMETITEQLDSLFPTLDAWGYRPRESEGPHDFHLLKEHFQRIKDRQAEGKAEGAENRVLTSMVARTEAAIAAFGESDCRPEEKEFCDLLSLCLHALDELLTLELPKLDGSHPGNLKALEMASLFERKREEDDWTKEMEEEEAQVYDEVDTQLELTEELVDTARTSLQRIEDLSSLQDALSTGLVDFDSKVAPLQDTRSLMRQKQTDEERMYADFKTSLQGGVEEARATQESIGSRSTAIVTQINGLIDELVQNQADLWREMKWEQICQHGLTALTERYEANSSSHCTALEGLELHLTTAAAALEAGKEAAQLTAEVSDALQGISSDKLATITNDMLLLASDEGSLLARKFQKTALAAYAADSRIVIKRQQREAVFVRKRRANAAQDHEGVAECNARIRNIEELIEEEEEYGEALTEDMQAITAEWKSVLELCVTSGQASGVQVGDQLRNDWIAMEANLRAIQESHSHMTDLADVLDSAFLDSPARRVPRRSLSRSPLKKRKGAVAEQG